MKIRINPLNVGIGASAIGFLANEPFRHLSTESFFGTLGVGIATGIGYAIGEFLPKRQTAKATFAGLAIKEANPDLPFDQNHPAVPHLIKGAKWAMATMAIGLTAAAVTYKFVKPAIRHWTEDKAAFNAKFRDNHALLETAVPYARGLSSLRPS